MRYLLIVLLAGSLAISCNKQSKETTWLEQRKQELSSCVCLTAIHEGTYQNEKVYEVRVIDALCNGINMVYKEDGTEIVHSGEHAAYQAYLK